MSDLLQTQSEARTSLMIGLSLVNKAFHRRLGLRADQLRTLENCDATVRSHVGGAGPDRHLKHRHSNHSADDENVTGHQT